MTAIHLSLIRDFQMSAIPRVFGLQLWNLVANFDMLFLVIGFISLVDEIQFMLISSRSSPIYFPRSQTPRVQTWRFIALRVKTYCGKRFAL